MMDAQKTLDAFVSIWNTPESQARAAILEAILAPDFYYADPRAPDGIDSAADFAEYLDQMFTDGGMGMVMERDGEPDLFGRHGRFHIMMKRDAEILGKGSYYIDFAENGRIRKALGFVGR